MSGFKAPMPAKQIVHWPGNEAPLCEEHLRSCVGMAALIGFMLTWTPCEEAACENCESQFKYLTLAERDEIMKGLTLKTAQEA